MDEKHTTACRERMWQNIPQDEHDKSTWEDATHYSHGKKAPWARTGPFMELMESVTDIAEQLLDEGSLM
ncbi:MAG: hypothetical protein QGH20_03220 [Candidatus Latescibacteria bacterium]|nr:hypothetical protein [Candidatus Latescibacterota bacterium]